MKQELDYALIQDGSTQIAKLIAASSQIAIKGKLKALALIEAKIDELFSRLYQLITSMDGMGKCIAAQGIVDTNEGKNIKKGKEYACVE